MCERVSSALEKVHHLLCVLVQMVSRNLAHCHIKCHSADFFHSYFYSRQSYFPVDCWYIACIGEFSDEFGVAAVAASRCRLAFQTAVAPMDSGRCKAAEYKVTFFVHPPMMNRLASVSFTNK